MKSLSGTGLAKLFAASRATSERENMLNYEMLKVDGVTFRILMEKCYWCFECCCADLFACN